MPPIVRVIVTVIIIWLIPTMGLLITSLRTQGAIESSGWWTVFGSFFDTSQWTLENYQEVLTSGWFDSAFVNTLIVAVPSTVMPITMAAFAAHAFSWMEFRGRDFLFVFVVALLVVPLQVALIPFGLATVALVSRRDDWPLAVLAGMGLSLAVGLPLLILP